MNKEIVFDDVEYCELCGRPISFKEYKVNKGYCSYCLDAQRNERGRRNRRRKDKTDILSDYYIEDN